MKLPSLQLGELTIPVPIIQGGMGVGVSRSSLASAVANQGGIGVISGVQIGFTEEDFTTNPLEANLRALRKEIRRAKELSPGGVIGLNLLVAMKSYKDMVKTAVEEGIDLIISGAGLPKNLPELVKGFPTKIAPIVSSGKAAALIAKLWDSKYGRLPDLVIVEGPEAGGHLGFSAEQLQGGEEIGLDKLIPEVIDALKPFQEKSNQPIPVIAAGGIFTGEDIAQCLRLGAAGVQMSTRFVATEECDAHVNFKQAYIDATQDKIQLVKSPVGMPGRAIRNAFVEATEQGPVPVEQCYDCLIPCNPATTPYCISQALIRSVQGDQHQGLIFTGSNAYRLDKMVTVKELMEQLIAEAKESLSQES